MERAALCEAKRAAFSALRETLGGKVVSGGEFLHAAEAAAGQGPSRAASTPQNAGEGFEPDRAEKWLGALLPGRLTEILGGPVGGGGLLMASILGESRKRRDYVALLDLGGGFHPESFPEEDLESLLWVVCASAEEALEAGEVTARDGNFRHVLFDFRGGDPSGWKRVAASRWYRLLAALREREVVGVVFADAPVTSASAARWQVELSSAGYRAGEAGRSRLEAPSLLDFLELPALSREILGRHLRIEALKGRGFLKPSGGGAVQRLVD